MPGLSNLADKGTKAIKIEEKETMSTEAVLWNGGVI